MAPFSHRLEPALKPARIQVIGAISIDDDPILSFERRSDADNLVDEAGLALMDPIAGMGFVVIRGVLASIGGDRLEFAFSLDLDGHDYLLRVTP